MKNSIHNLYDRFANILSVKIKPDLPGNKIGESRDGLPIYGYQFGCGETVISLMGGAHSDEPVGPFFLRHLVSYLTDLSSDDYLLTDFEWWIIPHINPDGEKKNHLWYSPTLFYDLASYLRYVFRELPGDDIEFCFPYDKNDSETRPENKAVYSWWQTCPKNFQLHVSLHGMAFGAGPWFLIDKAWTFRTVDLRESCKTLVSLLGYELHDVERNGEKGFFRIEKGFTTRPDSSYMKKHFRELGDENMAAKFRPSSMETIRSFSQDALTLVTEMPLFITPGAGENIGPPDPPAVLWKQKIDDWRTKIKNGEHEIDIIKQADKSGLRKMPVNDQMKFQWRFISAGIEQILK